MHENSDYEVISDKVPYMCYIADTTVTTSPVAEICKIVNLKKILSIFEKKIQNPSKM